MQLSGTTRIGPRLQRQPQATRLFEAGDERDRRMLRMGQALRAFAEELAAARREIDQLRAENQRLLKRAR